MQQISIAHCGKKWGKNLLFIQKCIYLPPQFLQVWKGHGQEESKMKQIDEGYFRWCERWCEKDSEGKLSIHTIHHFMKFGVYAKFIKLAHMF